MFEDNDAKLDMGKIMKRYANMNPHVSISDIAYLMDMPYSPDIDDEYPEINANQEMQFQY